MIGAEYAAISENLGQRQYVDLIKEPEITDPRLQMIMKLLCEITFVAYVMGRQSFMVKTVLRGVNLDLKEGHAPESAYLYNVFGFLVGHVFDDLASAKEIGELALLLDEHFDDPQRRAANLFTNIVFIQAWNVHPRELTSIYRRVIDIGLETGDLRYMSDACANALAWQPDLDLPSAIEAGKNYLETAATAHYHDGTDVAQIFQHVRLNLVGRTNARLSLSTDGFDEAAAVARFGKTGYHLGLCLHRIYKMQTCYTYAEYEAALKHAEAAERFLDTLAGQLQAVDFCLFAFLTRAALYPGANDKQQQRLWPKLKTALEQMRRWADHSSMNFGHYALAMSAEMARLRGQQSEAQKFYCRAIEAADRHGYRRYQGLFNELAGEFCAELGEQQLSIRHLRNARDCYLAWGATAKVEQLHERHPQWLVSGPESAVSAPESLDLASLLKASQAISEALGLLKAGLDPRIVVTTKFGAEESTIRGDAGQLENLLLNLGINSRDAMPDGGQLTLSTSNVTLDSGRRPSGTAALEAGRYLRISVKDTGSEISPEALPRVFEPFFTTKQRGGGTGLGLAAVYGSVKAHDGAVWVSSELGAGTEFEVYFPVCDKQPEPEKRSSAKRALGRRVLVVDDEPLVRGSTTLILQSLGYLTTAVAGGVEALAAQREIPNGFDVVVLDLVMPGMDGLSCLDGLRQRAPKLPILLWYRATPATPPSIRRWRPATLAF